MNRTEILEKVQNGESLRGAYLTGADLTGANLTGANLKWANLRDANLKGANLKWANLRDADLRGANLTGADLRGADLTIANLRGADLTGAYLRGADLSGTNLESANLTGAYLTGADLTGANLTGANLTRANLRGAYLRDANLERAKFDTIVFWTRWSNPKPLSEEELTQEGFEVMGEYVFAYRTKRSISGRHTVYEVGQHYNCKYFDFNKKEECSWGLYIASKEWLKENYSNRELVKVKVKRDKIMKAGDKYRCTNFLVVEE